MSSPYQYLLPTEGQKTKMQAVRDAAEVFHDILMEYLPDGPDKTYTIRNHRTTAMWANIAITRQPDGSPREED